MDYLIKLVDNGWDVRVAGLYIDVAFHPNRHFCYHHLYVLELRIALD